MKFLLDQEKVKDMLGVIGKVLPSKSSIPILNGVLVQVQDNCILFTGSNGSESVIHRIPAESDGVEIENMGSCVINRDCLDVAKKLKGKITFELDNSMIHLSQDKTKLSFSVLDAEDYPKISIETPSQPIVFTGKQFSDIVGKTAFAASTSDSRPMLQGINMRFSPTGNVFNATDSSRLGLVRLGVSEEELSITVPAKTMSHALKTFDLDKEIFVLPTDNQIAFANGNTVLYSRLLEGNYPNTERLIPQEFSATLILNREELVGALDVLAIMNKDNLVKLQVGRLFVELSVNSVTAKGLKEIAFESYDGEDGFEISFSAKLFLEALNSIETKSVILGFNGAMKPVVIKPVDEESRELQLVLPIRTK